MRYWFVIIDDSAMWSYNIEKMKEVSKVPIEVEVDDSEYLAELEAENSKK